MGKVHRVILISVVSGIFWAALAAVLGKPMAPIMWGGLVLAPLIGLGAGFASVFWPSASPILRGVLSLVTLYCAAATFGLGMAVYDLVAGPNPGDGPRVPSAVVIETILATLWGLTFTGYVIILWPLSYVNHSMISRIWKQAEPAPR